MAEKEEDVAPSSTGAPRTHNQPSRKTKSAWRKNIDLDPVITGTEEARQQKLETGGHLYGDLPSESLFQTDTAGSTEIQKTVVRKSGHGHIKADEIIAARSKTPAVSARKRAGDSSLKNTDGRDKRRRNWVSREEVEKLKKFAYSKGAGAREAMQTVEDENVTEDPWDSKTVQAQPGTLAVASSNPSARTKPDLSTDPWVSPTIQKPIREPHTLRHAPIALTTTGKPLANIANPAAGHSYNPAFPDWQDLVSRAGAKEVDAEAKRRVAEEAEREREARVAAAAEEAERHELDAPSEYESEWEGVESEWEEGRLSAKRPGRKTPAERNKAKRRKEGEARERHEVRMRERDRQEKRLDEIRRQVLAERDTGALTRQEWSGFDSDGALDEADDCHDEGERLDLTHRPTVRRRDADGNPTDPELRRRLRRYKAKRVLPEQTLDIVLADELQDSLRKLKPEGNLLKDRFTNAIVQGKIEGRRQGPPRERKKGKRAYTEKWSYKDWRLPSGKGVGVS
ncbi:MAG: hypothetical protein M1831_003541 [Alyxoria varia]|nr:MAG: hypothetical protein M1831_003541 [Alyxoria varia]